MNPDKLYDVRRVVEAYVDAQRPPYPHEDFRTFWKNRLSALESAYGIRMDFDGVRSDGVRVLWMHFSSVAHSLLVLEGPRAGVLEDTLLNDAIERVDSPTLKLRETEALLHAHLKAARDAHYQLLESLFSLLWGPIEKALSSRDLAKLGFDDSTEPKVWDYYDEM